MQVSVQSSFQRLRIDPCSLYYKLQRSSFKVLWADSSLDRFNTIFFLLLEYVNGIETLLKSCSKAATKYSATVSYILNFFPLNFINSYWLVSSTVQSWHIILNLVNETDVQLRELPHAVLTFKIPFFRGLYIVWSFLLFRQFPFPPNFEKFKLSPFKIFVICLECDFGESTFSPEGRLFEIEYEMESIKLLSTDVGIKVADR